MNLGDHRELIVWQKAMEIVVGIYRLTKTFPAEERYGLTSQMRRAAISIPSNIAEGRRRNSENDYQRFLTIAFGSGAELETQLEIAERLCFGDRFILDEQKALLFEVMRMLNKMTSKEPV